MVRFLSALLLLSGTAMAQDLPQGRFDGYSCSMPSDLSLTITGNEIRFHESLCRVIGAMPVPQMPQTHIYRATCAGEGMEWERHLIVTDDIDNGLIIVGDGFGVSYDRCP